VKLSHIDERFMFTIECMKVSRVMFLPEQLNADTLKDANREHGYVSKPP